MTLRDSLLPVLNSTRTLVQNLGLRQTRIFIRAGTWSADQARLGDLTDADTEILPRPKVESRGNELLVSKITPSFDGGGYNPSELVPDVQLGVDRHWVVMQPDGALRPFFLADVNVLGNFNWKLTLRPLDHAVPDRFAP